MEGPFRSEAPDYPLIAVREAVTNALMHRDYSQLARGTQVQVNLYTDHLEILNPGGLYGTVTLSKLGGRGLSSARNQRLSTLLEEVPYPGAGMVAENRGSGYLMIESQLQAAGLAPPEPDDDISSFSLVFRLTSHRAAGRVGTGKAAARIGTAMPSRQVIEAYLKSKGIATARELHEATGLSRPAVSKHLRALAADGRVVATHPTRSRFQQYKWTGPS
jgi:ATP-dependent DNA helicase RecG